MAEFELVLNDSWKKLASEKMYSGGVEIVARGDGSLVFADAMAEALGLRPLGGTARNCEMNGILTGEPKTIFTAPFWLQLVHGSLPSDDYTELYTYIDIPGQRIRIRKGDKRYRTQLMRLLVEPHKIPETTPDGVAHR